MVQTRVCTEETVLTPGKHGARVCSFAMLCVTTISRLCRLLSFLPTPAANAFHRPQVPGPSWQSDIYRTLRQMDTTILISMSVVSFQLDQVRMKGLPTQQFDASH